MISSVDYALVGTGVAPLIAASRLLNRGETVAVFNPDRDFFREDSELAVLPLQLSMGVAKSIKVSDLKLAEPKRTLEILGPDYPGAVELDGKDKDAPQIRGRSWIWMADQDGAGALEDLFLKASEAGHHPIETSGTTALKQFPGSSARGDGQLRGVVVPRVADVDVRRYRFGLLEFVRERLTQEDLLFCPASHIEVKSKGMHCLSLGKTRQIEVQKKVMVFWTPRLSTWVRGLIPRKEFPAPASSVWELWSLVSRDPLQTEIAGVFENMTAWPESEGILKVLRRGKPEEGFAGSESFKDLWRLTRGLLGWEKFSIRAMAPRLLFFPIAEDSARTITHLIGKLEVEVIPQSDGPLLAIVEAIQNRLGSRPGAA